MVTILPQKRSPWEFLADAMSQFGQNAPQLLEERFRTQRGLGAIDKLQQDLQESGGDLTKMLPALARAYTLNPNLERSGIGQTFLQGAKVGRAFPGQQGMSGGPQTDQGAPFGMQGAQGMSQNIPGQPSQSATEEAYKGALPGKPTEFATPGPFNILTAQDIDAESQRYASAVNDPSAYALRQSQLSNKNRIATEQREALQDSALAAGITPDQLPRFMVLGAKFDPRNPSEWLRNTDRAYKTMRNNERNIERTFIPGMGSALLGKNRETELKNLVPLSQTQKKLGLEDETRNYYADQYMSPTEIEEQFRPLTKEKAEIIQGLPEGSFPRGAEEFTVQGMGVPPKRRAEREMSYEEMLEKNPEKLEKQQNLLSKFFLKNVDDDTSLLVLRHKLWKDKGYDWRQIGPAIHQAEENGLKLTQRQNTELADIDTQPPFQSLPDIFRDLDRIPQYLRGVK